MKKLSFYIVAGILLSSCASTVNEIGGLSMLSDRHIDPNRKYEKLATRVGCTKREIKASCADNIEAAINQVLNQVPGAEYLTNVKIYAVNGDYLAVSGDVWGYKNENNVDRTNNTQAKLVQVNSDMDLNR